MPFKCNHLDAAEMADAKTTHTEGCMGEQTSLKFDLTFGDVLLHKLVQA